MTDIIMIVLLVIAIIVGIVNIIMTMRRRGGTGGAISDDDMDFISHNMMDITSEAANTSATRVIAETKRDIEEMTRLIRSSYDITNQANNQNWQLFTTGVANNFAAMNDNQGKSLNEMVATIRHLVKTESDNAEKLEKHMIDFIDRLDARLKSMTAEMQRAMQQVREQNEKQLSEMRTSNTKSLEEMRATVDEKLTKTLNERLEQSFNTISERLESVHKGLGEMKALSNSVGDLNRVLNNVKVRGNWGEVALESLLEQVLSPEQYERQYRIEEKREAVDFAIRMPGREKGEKLYLPIDAKFPFDDYERMLSAADNADALALEIAAKGLEARIKKEAKSISDKYIIPPLTTNFAIMYLPIEGLFAEVVKRPGLCQELQNKYKVVVCGPTTITALLNSLQLGFKTLAVQEKSLEVWKALATFKKEFSKFAESIDKTQKKIDEASSSLIEASSRTVKIRKKLDVIENDTPTELLEE